MGKCGIAVNVLNACRYSLELPCGLFPSVVHKTELVCLNSSDLISDSFYIGQTDQPTLAQTVRKSDNIGRR